jgi:tRNA threonylcarbamoyl adenosine modification protein (Sua5/YciO/YrdC/YwlC family)
MGWERCAASGGERLMAQFFSIHPDNPQQRLIRQAAAMLRLRQIREVDEQHHFTLMCRDLSEIASYARVDNARFRQLKNHTPGSYTFILEATKEVPRRLQHPKRSTIGIRIPDHAVALALLEELREPLLSTTLILPGMDYPLTDIDEIRELLEHRVELIIEGGVTGVEPTTVIDLTGEAPVLVRRGRGVVDVFGIEG